MDTQIYFKNQFKDLKSKFESFNFDRYESIDWSRLNKRFASLTADAEMAYLDLYTNSNGIEVLDNMVGQYQPGTNGRWFRFTKNGATAITVPVIATPAGNLYQSSADDSQFTGMSVLAAAIVTSGQQSVTVTLGTTTVNINDFLGGDIVVNVAPDTGSEYIITGHTTGTSGQNITVTLDRPLQVAWTTATKINMRRNPWSGVVVLPTTTPTAMAAGFAVTTCLASVANTTTLIKTPQYTWLQTHGVAPAMADTSAILKGSNISTGSAVGVGMVQLHPFSGNATGIGTAIMPNASATKMIQAFISID